MTIPKTFDDVVHQDVDWLKVNEALRRHLDTALKQARREAVGEFLEELAPHIERSSRLYPPVRLTVFEVQWERVKAKYLGK